MKKILFGLGLMSCITITAQKQNHNILQSKDIKEIENFLKTAHPEDPRRMVLRPKLIALKNAAWTQGKTTAKPMEARLIVAEIPKNFATKPYSSESQEFSQLMANNSEAHKEKTVKLLNTLFDQDITKKEVILLVQNNSDCNMVLKIQGKDYYNVAVPAHGENSVVLNKGDYQLSSSLCDAKYNSAKSIAQNTLVILNNPVYSTVPKRNLATTSAQKKLR